MKSFKLLIPVFAATMIMSTSCGDSAQSEDSKKSKYTYESVENDPFGLRIYTLENGLKVYISENHAEPRVQTNIAVRTGSKQDPADATGLAHYLEHMLFKGTSELGSLDWEKEQVLLKEISDLYEAHRNTQDVELRKNIYHKIDSISLAASSFVATNEYDKMISGMGAQGTNAYTSNERTVYINDIPSTEFEKWLAVESERFSELVLRLFHTELEAVYEEFNRSQDSDGRQAYYKLLDMLFPSHPYGQQTTIGTGEHLKSPSMEKIHDYFKRRYVPNNMAIILAGDLDPDATIALVDKYFGGFERKEVENPAMPKEAPIAEPQIADVQGSEAEFEMVGYRLEGANSKDALYSELLDGILANGKAGLIDLNLNQQQKVLRAYSSLNLMEDYSYFMLVGYNRQGQSLEEVRNLLIAQIDSVKEGKFEDWMIDAVVRKFKKDLMSQMESNRIRAYYMVDAFILNQDWKKSISKFDDMQKISKQDLMAWTKEKFGQNYAAVDKKIGEKEIHKVDKPEITPIQINREISSSFYNKIDSMESARLTPQFINFKEAITKGKLGDKIEVSYVQNKTNELFSLYYVLDMGSNHNPWLPIAIDYLPYLGTAELSPSEVQKELFKLGVSFEVFSSEDKAYVMLTGLKETYAEGVQLFESLLKNVVADPKSYNELIAGVLKKRADQKLNKRAILFNGLGSYAEYGAQNPFNTVLSEKELISKKPEELVAMIHNLTSFEHRVLFYGPQAMEEAVAVLEKAHNAPSEWTPKPEAKKFEQIATEENKVYFVEYDMVQSELMLMHRGPIFTETILPEAKIFSEYFGSGLSSIVFQEIRESKALAYSAYAGFNSPREADKHHYVRGYIGSQANKLEDATAALLDLMSTLPKADQQFEQAKISALKQIETNRTSDRSILWNFESARNLGLDYDLNEKIYPQIQKMTFDDVQAFFDAQVKDKPYTYLVIGKKSEMDMKALEKLGPVTELSLKQVFGY